MRSGFLALPAGMGPLAALGLASFLWGTADVAGKLALVAVPPATLAALRFVVALAILWPLSRWRGEPRVPARITAPLGLLGVALTFIFQNLGLARTTAMNASLLQGAVPILTLILAAAILGERLGWRRILAVIVALLGVAAVTLPSANGLRVPGMGDGLVLASTGCFALFVVLGRRAFPAYGTFSVLAGMAAWGTAALLPLAVAETWVAGPPTIHLQYGILVAYLGVGCSALTYVLWGYALRHVEAGSAALFDSLIPGVGVVTAVLVLQEAPLVWHLIGGTLVVAGVWLAVCEPKHAVTLAPMQLAKPHWAGKIRLQSTLRRPPSILELTRFCSASPINSVARNMCEPIACSQRSRVVGLASARDRAREWVMKKRLSALLRCMPRLATLLALVASVAGMTPGVTSAQAALAELTPWGLEGSWVQDLALNPDGGVYIASARGLWQATAEDLPEPLATAGLPAPCVAPQEDGVCNAHSIAVDTAGTIYAPIGSSQISTPGGYRDANVGLYRLVAGAFSWEQIAVPQDFLCTPSGSSEPVLCSQIPLVATGPDDSIYVVASGQHAFSPQDSDGLYRSTDGGQSWQLLPRSTDEMPVLDALAVGPDGRIWLGGGYVFSVFVHYILTSGDGGQTWEFSKIDPSQEKSTGHAVTDVAFHGSSTYITTRPAAGAGTEGHPVGVYRTDDGGRTWVQLTEDNPGQFMQALAVAVNGDIYHSQWGGIRRSTDGGATWQEFTATDSYIYALAIDYNGALWVGTESGLFRTGSPIAPPSEPPVRSTGTSGGTTTGGTTTGPGEGTIRTGVESDQFKSDCFAAEGAYYELGDGSHGCLFPDGSELDCSAQGACQLADPVGIIIAPRGSGR